MLYKGEFKHFGKRRLRVFDLNSKTRKTNGKYFPKINSKNASTKVHRVGLQSPTFKGTVRKDRSDSTVQKCVSEKKKNIV